MGKTISPSHKAFMVMDKNGKFVGFLQSTDIVFAREKLRSLKEEYVGIQGYNIYTPQRIHYDKEYVPRYARPRLLRRI